MKLHGLRERIQNCKSVEEVEICLKETSTRPDASQRTKRSWVATARKTLKKLTEQPVIVKKKVEPKKK